MAHKPGPGDRQPGETQAAYRAYRIYLEHGPGRTTAAVGQQLGHRSARQAQTWSAKYDWGRRVAEYEKQAIAAADEAHIDEIGRAARRHAKDAQRFAGALALIAEETLRRIIARPEFLSELDDDALVKALPRAALAFNRAVLGERLARGMTTEQPGEPIPREVAEQQARRMSREELERSLAGFDELAERRDRKAGDG